MTKAAFLDQYQREAAIYDVKKSKIRLVKLRPPAVAAMVTCLYVYTISRLK